MRSRLATEEATDDPVVSLTLMEDHHPLLTNATTITVVAAAVARWVGRY